MNMESENGFTLVELLITIVVVSILLATGIPSFMEFVKNNRLSAQANNLVISIQVARSEAVKRGSGSVICASADQATCSGDDDWTTGWIVYSDVNQNGNLDLGGGDCETDDCIVRTNGRQPSTALEPTIFASSRMAGLPMLLPLPSELQPMSASTNRYVTSP